MKRRGFVSYALLKGEVGKLARLSIVNRRSGLEMVDGSTIGFIVIEPEI